MTEELPDHLRDALSRLPREIPPSRDLWVGIEESLTAGPEDRASGVGRPERVRSGATRTVWIPLAAAATLAAIWLGTADRSGPALPEVPAAPVFSAAILGEDVSGLGAARAALEGSPAGAAIAPSLAVLDSLMAASAARLESHPRDAGNARELVALERRRVAAVSHALRVMMTSDR